jgi:hypothetical protein
MNSRHERKEAMTNETRARECAEEIFSEFEYWPTNEGPVLEIIQRHLDALKDYYESPDCPITVQAFKNGVEAGRAELKEALEKAKAELVFHNHRCEAQHNEGQPGLPQGDCQCSVCADFFKQLTASQERERELRNVINLIL